MNQSKRNPIIIKPLEQVAVDLSSTIPALRSKSAVSAADSLDSSRSTNLAYWGADPGVSSRRIEKSGGNRQQMFYVGAFRSNGVTKTLFLDDHIELAPNIGDNKRYTSPTVVSTMKPIVSRTRFIGDGCGIPTRILSAGRNSSTVSGRISYLASATSVTAALAKYLPVTREKNSHAMLSSQIAACGDNLNQEMARTLTDPSGMGSASQPMSSSSQTVLSAPPSSIESLVTPEKRTVTLTCRTVPTRASVLRPVRQPLSCSMPSDGVSETYAYGHGASVALASLANRAASLTDHDEKNARPEPAQHKLSTTLESAATSTAGSKTLPDQTSSGMYMDARGRLEWCNSSLVSMQTERPIVYSIVGDKMAHSAGDVHRPELYYQAECEDEPSRRAFERSSVRQESNTSSTGIAMPFPLSTTLLPMVVEIGDTHTVASHTKAPHFLVAPNPVACVRKAPNTGYAVGSGQPRVFSLNSAMPRTEVDATLPSYLEYNWMRNSSRLEECYETSMSAPQTPSVSVLGSSGHGSNVGAVPPFFNRITPYVQSSSFHNQPVPTVIAAMRGALPIKSAPPVGLIRPTSRFKSPAFVFPVGHSLICVPQKLTTVPSAGGNTCVANEKLSGNRLAPQQLVVNSSPAAVEFRKGQTLLPPTAFSVMQPMFYHQPPPQSKSLGMKEEFGLSNYMSTLDAVFQIPELPSDKPSCQCQLDNRYLAVSTQGTTSTATQQLILPSTTLACSSMPPKPYNLRHGSNQDGQSLDDAKVNTRSGQFKKIKIEDTSECSSPTTGSRVVRCRRPKLKVRFVNHRNRKVILGSDREVFSNSGGWSPSKLFPAAVTGAPTIAQQTSSTQSHAVDLSNKRKYQSWQQSEPTDRPPLQMLEALCLRIKNDTGKPSSF